ncbi:capsular biosynthesis protein [Burkholderia cenocepacia]|nr:capsular biosynthesis protein [Burkholderia cenocepacia]
MLRSYLALQGTASPFFNRLTDALRGRGHAVRRVNFCGGDLLYGGGRDVWNYPDRLEGLPVWYRELAQTGNFTDILMFGDCREVHRYMHPIAQEFGLKVHVFEEGYIRPHWITLERHGVNGRSLLPRDPAWYRENRSITPSSQPGRETGYNLYERAFHDICYRAANVLHSRRFPFYRSHRPKNGFYEYAGLARRTLQQRLHRQEAERVIHELLGTPSSFYLFPLQLNSDSQIVAHSPFEGVRDAISMVLRSFAENAPTDTVLVIKNHPLDTGLIDFRRFALSLARDLGVESRLRFVDAGHLPTLLEHAKGVIVVNSTVGLSALHHGRPLIALGTAVYDMPGLTWQGKLNDFWTQAKQPPDEHLYHAFLDYVMHHTQINGDFYTRSGIAMAIAGAVERLERADG